MVSLEEPNRARTIEEHAWELGAPEAFEGDLHTAMAEIMVQDF